MVFHENKGAGAAPYTPFVVCIALLDHLLESIEKDILTHNHVIDYRG